MQRGNAHGLKVRIGVAVGGRGAVSPETFGAIVDDLDTLGFDSVWIPETFLAGTLDPLVALSYAAARAPRLKLGTHIVTPGRNTYGTAKALAQLDRLSHGRLLLTFVAGLNHPLERIAQGMPTGDRTVWFDEELPRMRRWWSGEEVDGIALDTRPLQDPLEVWLGGQAASALQRVGRLGDGWLPGAISHTEAVAGRATIDDVAAHHGREISREHFGINLVYTFGETVPDVPAPARGVGDTSSVTAAGVPALRELIASWVDVGFSKIVVRPIQPPDDWHAELHRLADAVLDLQTPSSRAAAATRA
jgi:probable F420-dependent oxidoreductase